MIKNHFAVFFEDYDQNRGIYDLTLDWLVRNHDTAKGALAFQRMSRAEMIPSKGPEEWYEKLSRERFERIAVQRVIGCLIYGEKHIDYS